MSEDIIGYRKLSEEEVEEMNTIKTVAEDVRALVERLEKVPGYDQECVEMSKQYLQTGFMWLTRAVGQPQSF